MLELGLAGLLWKILALLWFLGLWSFQGFGVLEASRSWMRVCGFKVFDCRAWGGRVSGFWSFRFLPFMGKGLRV